MSDSLAALDALIDNVDPGATLYWHMSRRTWRLLRRLSGRAMITMARTIGGQAIVRRVRRIEQQRYRRDGWHPVPRRRWKNAVRKGGATA